MKRGALLVNFGWGELIDKEVAQTIRQAAMLDRLADVGLDVFWEEPGDPADEIFAFPNVIALPHTGEPVYRYSAGSEQAQSSIC